MSFIPEALMIGGQIAGAAESRSADVERQRRYLQLLAQIQAFQRQQLGQGMGMIESQTASNVSAARSAAVRRAAAMGRSGNVEAIAQPIESNVANAGANAEERFIAGVNSQAAQAELGAAQSFADRPIPSQGLSDTLLTAGQAYSAYDANQRLQKIENQRTEAYNKYIDAYTKSMGNYGSESQPAAPSGQNLDIPGSYSPPALPPNDLLDYGRRLRNRGFGNPNYQSWLGNY